MRPALFFFSSSFLRSSIFSENGFPANSTGKARIFSCGRGGRLSPQMTSTRLVLIPTRPEPPCFLIFSSSFRASAGTASEKSWMNGKQIHTSSDDGWIYTYGFVSFWLICCPDKHQYMFWWWHANSDHSCQVGTSSRPCFKSSQLASSCFDAWLKYRPSVANAAFSNVITAVPAEPEKPQTHSDIVSFLQNIMTKNSDLGERHMERYILIDGSPRMERLV